MNIENCFTVPVVAMTISRRSPIPNPPLGTPTINLTWQRPGVCPGIWPIQDEKLTAGSAPELSNGVKEAMFGVPEVINSGRLPIAGAK
jgi:hypothetical protein